MNPVNIGLIFGGKSAEHEISLRSAQAIFSNLDRSRYQPLLIYIDRLGKWRLTRCSDFNEESYAGETGHPFLPWEMQDWVRQVADIYFPILHGPYGEDGRIQGLLEMAGKPFVGASSFSSALAMDKVVSKILFRQAGLKVADFLHFTTCHPRSIRKAVESRLSYPVFVKPCSLGSSVGISKVKREEELEAAVVLAFSYDQKILVENAVNMREIEVSVMGNEEVMVSRPGELIPHQEFYDYQDKYILNKTRFHIPALLPPAIEERIRRTAEQAYRCLFLNGMARVDLFLEKETEEVYVNEINTIPGFTTISMFPKLWQVQGISFTDLVTRLIEYGFEFQRTQKSRVDVADSSGR